MYKYIVYIYSYNSSMDVDYDGNPLRAYCPDNYEPLPEGTIVKLSSGLDDSSKAYLLSKGITEDSLGVIYGSYKSDDNIMEYYVLWKTSMKRKRQEAERRLSMNWDEIISTNRYILENDLRSLKSNPRHLSVALTNAYESPRAYLSKVSALRAKFETPKTPKTPKTPRTPKTPKTPRTPRTPSGGGKKAQKSRKVRKSYRKSRKARKSRRRHSRR